MRELAADLETARDRMRRVELEWDGNLEGILSRTGSIRVREVPDYKEEVNPVMIAGKHRMETSTTPGEFYYPNSIAIVFNKSLEFLLNY